MLRLNLMPIALVIVVKMTQRRLKQIVIDFVFTLDEFHALIMYHLLTMISLYFIMIAPSSYRPIREALS